MAVDLPLVYFSLEVEKLGMTMEALPMMAGGARALVMGAAAVPVLACVGYLKAVWVVLQVPATGFVLGRRRHRQQQELTVHCYVGLSVPRELKAQVRGVVGGAVQEAL